MLTASDFAKPPFYLRDWEKVWVVLYCSPDARPCHMGAPQFKEFAAAFRDDDRVRVRLVLLPMPERDQPPDPSPETAAANALGITWPGVIQIFNMRPEDYAVGVKVPIHPGPYTSAALRRATLKALGEPVVLNDLLALVRMPAFSLGGGTLLLAWLLYRGVSWAAASAEASVAERTAPEVQAQQAEVAQINASALGARRKRQAELLEQRRQAAQALVK